MSCIYTLYVLSKYYCKSCNSRWIQVSVKFFREPIGVIINSVGPAGGRKALVASVFILGDILNLVKTDFYRNHQKENYTEYYMIYSMCTCFSCQRVIGHTIVGHIMHFDIGACL